MKKTLLAVSALLSATGFAQTFSDNFDSYTAGQYMADQSSGEWTTWSNAPGTTEDVMVSSADSYSAPNSVYFSTSAQAGGPTDLVRNFGVLNTGQFSMEFNIKVENGKAGYFNFQKNAVIGQTWAMDCFFNDNGTLTINNQAGLNFSGSYTQGTWFNFRIDINFNTNHWEVFIDNNSIGSFSNPENQIASIDLYPTDQNSPYSCGYFIDDFQYTVTPYTLPNLNAAVTLISFDRGQVAGASVTPKVKVRNLGTSVINSFDLDVVYNGNTISQQVTGLNLASLAETTITMPGTASLIAGANDMVATVSNVNGGTDGDAADDSGTLSIDPVVPAAGKMVVGEEGTGTWCQWCPRGAVFMDMMETKYPEFWAGIAVHNGDPMTVTTYDAAMGSLISGYPSALVDRGAALDPSEIEDPFLSRLVVAPTAFITNGATWDAGTRTLNVSVSANFQSAATNNYKLAIVLTEDDVTGTGSNWGQSNAYAGGGNGVMGGFETLPNPVPAAQMVYDHVARSIVPSFSGYANSFPATVNAGETHTINYSFVLPAGWDENQIHIIGMLIAPNGSVDNAGKATITEAVANGFVDGTDVPASIDELNQVDATLQVYPNPANDFATIAVNLTSESNASVRILDMSGKTVASRNYGSISGASSIILNTQQFVPGMYLVELTLDNTVFQRQLVIE
jgi:archaellum component FlaF (FlaF/FlaG flagellin family)